MSELTPIRPPIEWSVAARALPGEEESGDLHLVALRPDGLLLAVVDGLGHGAEAAVAARTAAAALTRFVAEPLIALVQHCHECLLRTRGAVMTLAALDARAHTLDWLGIGNVEGVLLRADPNAHPPRLSAPLRGGVVGDRLPPLRMTTVPLLPGDTIVLATDGLAVDFVEGIAPDEPCARLANRLLARYARNSDDALVLVARYLGGTRTAPPEA